MAKELIFDTILDRTKKNKFLITDAFATTYFAGTDTRDTFEQNLKIQPQDWYYRNKKIKYTLNSWGYRTREFDEIDWKNSIVIFGCSNVFGVGVDDSDTVSFQLEKILGIPVINMGVGGTSMTYALHNSSILRDGYPTPRAVVQLWSAYDRTTFYRKRDLVSCGAWNLEKFKYMDAWSQDVYHAMTHAVFAAKISKLLWKDTKYFEASYFNETAELLDCCYLESVDKARDMSHVGKDTHLKTAVKIAKELNL